jgi:hypothetical protein
MLKNCNLNKDKIDDQQFDEMSKCAHIPREIIIFAPKQNVEKPIGQLKVLKQNGAPAAAKLTFSCDALARSIWESLGFIFATPMARNAHFGQRARSRRRTTAAPPAHHRRTTAPPPAHHRRTTAPPEAPEPAPEGGEGVFTTQGTP